MSLLVPQVVFVADSTMTHLVYGAWREDKVDNWTACGLVATALGYYQIGLAEVHCLDCVHAYETGM